MLYLLKQKGFLQSEKVEILNNIFLGIDNNVSTRVEEQYLQSEDNLITICFAFALIYVGVGTVVEIVVMAHSKFAMWGETRAQDYYINRIIDQNILKLWFLAGNNDLYTYDTTNKLYNDIIEITHHLMEIMEFSDEVKNNLTRLGLGTLHKNK